MSSRTAKKVAKKMVAEEPKTAAEKLTATIAAKTRTAKAVPQAKANGKKRPLVQAVLQELFSQQPVPAAESIIARLAKATGRAPLSVATLKLYRAKYQAGALKGQSGKPKVKCPPLQLANKF